MIIQTNTFQKKHFLYLGALFHLLAAFFSYGAHHPDELFQVFEFAGYKLGLNQASNLPWEFKEQMRSGIEPLFVYGITKLAHVLHLYNPFVLAFLLRTLVSFFSFYALILLLEFFEKEIQDPILKNNLWFLGTLFWCLPYFHARLLSENFATSLFIFGFLIALKNISIPASGFKLITAGFIMTLGFLCRFQISFMILGLFAWLLFVEKVNISKVLLLVFGALIAILTGLFIDHWLYDTWTLSWWNYLDLNLFKQAAAQFGVQPFYFFITESLAQLLPPFSLIFVFLFVYFWIQFRKHVLTWISLPFILIHFFVGHKELRFLFPILDFLPLIVVLSYSALANKRPKLYEFLTKKFLRRSFIVVNSGALLIFTFLPADNVTQVLKAVYNLSDNKEAVLIYQDENPYNNSGSLNYFKNMKVISVKEDHLNDTLLVSKDLYYFTEEFRISDSIQVKGITFKKVYSKYPWWFVYFNYNNWLERAGFCLYKK